MGTAAAADGPADRRLVEESVASLLSGAPAGWTHLRVEVESNAATTAARASVTTADGHPLPLNVPPRAAAALTDYQRRVNASRLVIDCDADRRLSMQTSPVGVRSAPPRRLLWVLAGTTVACVFAAGLVFAIGRGSTAPPRAAMIDVPGTSPRQQQALEVLRRWYDAENRADGAALRTLACAHPGKNVEDEIEGFEQTAIVHGIVYLEAVVGFRDSGDRVWGRFMYRVRPIDDKDAALVDEAQRHGGYFSDEYTLVQEGADLKVCDADSPPRV